MHCVLQITQYELFNALPPVKHVMYSLQSYVYCAQHCTVLFAVCSAMCCVKCAAFSMLCIVCSVYGSLCSLVKCVECSI